VAHGQSHDFEDVNLPMPTNAAGFRHIFTVVPMALTIEVAESWVTHVKLLLHVPNLDADSQAELKQLLDPSLVEKVRILSSFKSEQLAEAIDMDALRRKSFAERLKDIDDFVDSLHIPRPILPVLPPSTVERTVRVRKCPPELQNLLRTSIVTGLKYFDAGDFPSLLKFWMSRDPYIQTHQQIALANMKNETYFSTCMQSLRLSLKNEDLWYLIDEGDQSKKRILIQIDEKETCVNKEITFRYFPDNGQFNFASGSSEYTPINVEH